LNCFPCASMLAPQRSIMAMVEKNLYFIVEFNLLIHKDVFFVGIRQTEFGLLMVISRIERDKS
jgi:hypothetical protein